MPDQTEDGIGYLTWDEFERFRRAVDETRRLIPWLRVAGYIRSGDHDELKHRSTDRPLGLPPTWIAAEEISNLLQEINQWHELEDVAVHGADFAMQLTKEVETARGRWPYEERSHKIQYMRCQACNMFTLRYHPPRTADERITVKCSTKTCRAVMDEDMFSFAAALIESENNARRLADRKRRGDKSAPVEEDDLQVGA